MTNIRKRKKAKGLWLFLKQRLNKVPKEGQVEAAERLAEIVKPSHQKLLAEHGYDFPWGLLR